jgi:inner membrane protein
VVLWAANESGSAKCQAPAKGIIKLTKDSVMASAFSHTFVAVALGSTYARRHMPWYFWGLSITCAILPDADVIGFAMGVPYNSLWGHRGLSHSLCFAFVVGLGVVSLAFREYVAFSRAWWSHVLYFSMVTASHGVLDAMTDGGRGIAFFAPFDTTRHFFPWRPVRVSPISIWAFFSLRGLYILGTELVFIWLPTTLLCAVVRVYRRRSMAAILTSVGVLGMQVYDAYPT